jgi:chloride channel 3/4/5
MPADVEANEQTRLLHHDRRVSAIQHEADAESILGSNLSKEELLLADSVIGERLPYNDYTTIDWLHDMVSS